MLFNRELCFWSLTGRYGKAGRVCRGGVSVTETWNLLRDPILEDLNTNYSELLQNVKDLKDEMDSVKRENERILRAQEELNQILIEKFQTEGKGRRS